MPPPVIAIVLNWNNLPDTLDCVESLRCSDYSNLSVWVVDNDSAEDPTFDLQAKYPEVRVFRNSKNLGYAGGNNRGVRAAMDCGAAYVLLLNNDVVVAPDCIRRLVTAAQANRHIGMATPKVFHYHRPHDVYWDGGVVDWQSGDARHASSALPVEGGIVRSEWLNGCSLLVRWRPSTISASWTNGTFCTSRTLTGRTCTGRAAGMDECRRSRGTSVA